MEKDKPTYKIRFNTNSTLEETRWRIIDSNDKEILVKDIIINVPCYTSVDWCEDIKDYKYHITTTGKLSFLDDVAVISVSNN
jgi:dTDP-4-dehydrorhamnose reductase